MIHDTIARWHQHVHGAHGVLDDILADDVVFYSPVVYTPQRGKAIAKQYLTAAVVAFVGPAHDDIADPNQPTTKMSIMNVASARELVELADLLVERPCGNEPPELAHLAGL